MRSCPTCQRTYPDDNQSNCPFDGAPLSAPYYPQPGQYQQQYAAPQPPPPQPGMNPMPPPPQGYSPPPYGWQQGQGYPQPAFQPAPQPNAGQYAPCPRCQRPDPEKVNFTWWGGVIGPRMLSHVKCRWCGAQYNGKTGQSNTTGIIIYSVVVFVIVFAIGLAIILARS
ncbi:MAG TPA: hypothetical protein VKB86_16505 [Pyrinomonadaceae bacterium]|nr:hypothetical protein [Pyrinomonadaceae bacterium]